MRYKCPTCGQFVDFGVASCGNCGQKFDWNRLNEEVVSRKEGKINVDNNLIELNIQPQAGVIGVFSRLNYKPWYAIAEFVDNSTQSFFSNEKALADVNFTTMTVNIFYNAKENVLTIVDDAFGMELDDFTRAVRLDAPPEQQGGRNEFGMGLKTAASWFGNIWSVESTQFGSTNKYYTEVDISKLRAQQLNSVSIERSDSAPETHGTIIIIRDITKKIDSSRTKGKIISLLESMYRRDINSDKIRIYYNDRLLNYTEYKCLNFRDKIWKKDLDFSFSFDNIEHHVTGFVGILEDGGYGKAGFALFRRGRVVIGGEEQNYKPERIFIQPQSTIAHKLFGELNVEDFPVNQAKDGFVWDDGLEEAFIEALKFNIQDYIKIAKMTKKERAQEEQFSEQASNKVESDVKSFAQQISQIGEGNINGETSDNIGKTGVSNDSESDYDAFNDYLKISNNLDEKRVGTKREYEISINPVVKKTFIVEWSIGNRNYWIDVEGSESSKVKITININHPFFKPYSNDEGFKVVLEKFVIAFIVAEQQAALTSTQDGYISSCAIRNNMNDYLSKVTEEDDGTV